MSRILRFRSSIAFSIISMDDDQEHENVLNTWRSSVNTIKMQYENATEDPG